MPVHHKGSAREVRALDAYVKAMRATGTLASRLERSLVAHRLTLGQLGVLEALYHLGPMSQKTLAAKLLRSSANVCTVVDNLERDGLVERERSTADRRVVNVRLTRAGQRVARRVVPEHISQIAELMGALTADEQEQLARLCKKLGLAAAAR